MVTLVVISIGILALVHFQSFALRSAALASKRATAITIAQDKMAKLRTFSSIKVQSNADNLAFAGINGSPAKSVQSNYTVEVTVVPKCYDEKNNFGCDGNGVPDMKQVTITVSWANEAHNFTLSSYIASIHPSAPSQLYK